MNAERRRGLQREIEELHIFFEAWFRAEIEPDESGFSRVAGVLASEFCIVTPAGELIERDALLENLRAAHGKRAGVRLRIEDVRPRFAAGGIVVATYIEVQEEEQSATRRLSTVVFAEKPGKPNRLEWLHVHETWLSDAGQDPQGDPRGHRQRRG